MHAYRAYLEQQADRIEAVLAAGRAPVHITGGTIGPEWIRFLADPAPHIRFAAVQAQQARLSERLGLDVTVTREPEGLIIKFPTPPLPQRRPEPAHILELEVQQ